MENRILLKARELMVLNGVRYMTMDDLANQLGISKKTIYQFYKDKESLVLSVVELELEEQRLMCSKSHENADNAVHEMFMVLEDIQKMFKKMNPNIVSELHKYFPEAFNRIQEHKRQYMHNIVKNNLIRGVEQGVYRKDINPEILTIFRLETSLITFDTQAFPLSKFDLAKVNHQIMEHFIYGLMSPEGLRLMEQYKLEKVNELVSEPVS
jgi:AcrR family transcriptional regulator